MDNLRIKKMKTEKIIRYTASAFSIFIMLHFVIFPGLEYPNTVTKAISLGGFFFLLFWLFGWIKVTIKVDSEKENQ